MSRESRLEPDDDMFQNLLDAIPYVAYLIDADTFTVLAANRVMNSRFGTYGLGAPCYGVYKARTSPCENCPVLLHRSGILNKHEIVPVFCNATQRWLKVSASIFKAKDGRTLCVLVAIPSDDQSPSFERVDDFGYTDTCTGIANNHRYEETGPALLRACLEQGCGAVVLALKVAGLHRINSVQGYARGDEALRGIARAVQEALPAGSLFARRRGNDFSIIYPRRGKETQTELLELNHRLERAINAACANIHHDWVKTRFGISVAPEQGIAFEQLNRKARQAVALGEHSNCEFSCHLYDDELMRRIRDKEELTLDLSVAVRRGEMTLLFQPQYNIHSARIVGAEALIRWNHPGRGLVGPDVFIPLAEENFTIPAIDNWVINEVCNLWRHYLNEGYPMVPVSINISPQRFYQSDFVHLLGQTLQRYRLPPHMLEVELTERTALQDISKAVEIMDRLRSRGFRVAIDDFGTGYSSLNYLRSLPFDTVKLDRTFIAEPNDKLHDVLKNIVSMVKIYDAAVVFEGVETEDQFEMAKSVGCDLIQGYFTGRPMLPKRLAEILASQNEPLTSWEVPTPPSLE